MSAPFAYLTGLLRAFSTFAVAEHLTAAEIETASLLLTAVVRAKRDYSAWSPEDVTRVARKTKVLNQSAIAQVIRFVVSQQPVQTKIALTEFELALAASGCSEATIKNYRSDINQFWLFCHQTDLSQALTKPKVAAFLKYQHDLGLQPTSIQRKLVALSQLARWAEDARWLKSVTKWLLPLSTSWQPDQASSGKKLARQGRLSIPEVKRWWTAGQRSSQDFRLRMLEQLGRSGSGNLKGSPGLKYTAYFTALAFLLFFAGLGVFGYQQFVQNAARTLAYPTSLTPPNRELSFQGRLTDTAKNPITTLTAMQFRLYDTGPGTGGTELWDSGSCNVTPDADGIFTVNLGDDCGTEITQDVFTENANVWLEAQIAAETLTPRQGIKTVAYAINAETVQGYPASASAVENTVLVMNNSGEVVLGNTSPVLKSTGTSFAIEAQTLTLQTAAASNGNIVLDPDGTGKVGIGTTAPTALLDIAGTASTSGTLTFRGTTDPKIDILNGENLGIRTSLNGDAGLTERFTILNNGNVGVGTTSPGAKLGFVADGTAAGGIDFGGDVNLYRSLRAGSYELTTDDTILSPGLVFNGSAPNANNTMAGGDFMITENNDQLSFWEKTGGTSTERMVMNHSGNLGIGSTSPGKSLDVVGEGRFSTDLTVSGGDITGANSAAIDIGEATSGDVEITGDLLPSADATYDLGSTAKSWRNAYLTGSLCFDDSDCASTWTGLGVNYWTLANGTVSPTNPTLDLLVGASATASAKFAFINVNSGAPTASIAGNLAIAVPTGANPATHMNIYNGGSFGLQTSVGGDASLTERLTILNNGNVGIGTTTPSQLFEVKTSTNNYLVTFNNTYTDPTNNSGLLITGTNSNTSGGYFGNRAPGINIQNTNGTANTYGSVTFSDAGGNGVASINGIFQDDANNQGSLAFFTRPSAGSGTEVMRIASTGNVGIGSTTPGKALDVVGEGRISTDLTVSGGDITGANGTALDLGEATSGDITVTGDLITAEDSFIGLSSTTERLVFDGTVGDVLAVMDAGLRIYDATDAKYINIAHDGTDVNITTNGTTALNITSTQVEIGNGTDYLQIATTGDLTFVDADGLATISGPAGGDLNFSSANDGYNFTLGGGAGDDLIVDTDTLVVESDTNNIGIGTTTTGAKLDVAGTASISGVLTLGDNSSTTIRPAASGNITLQRKNGVNTWEDILTLNNASGNIGIGSANPAYTLEVVGTGRFSTTLSVGTDLTVAGGDITGANGAIIDIGEATSGDVEVTGNLLPSADATYDLGSTAKSWRNGYLTGNLCFDDTDCASSWAAVGVNYWTLANGTVSPTNPTLDLLVGASATASAKFAFINVNSGAPTASIAGNLAIAVPTGANPATHMNIYNGGSFGLQTSVGGDASLTERLTILNNGNVGIGTTSPSGILMVTGDEVRIGAGGTINYATGDGDLYVQDNVEIDGTLNATEINRSLATSTNFGRDAAGTVSVTAGFSNSVSSVGQFRVYGNGTGAAPGAYADFNFPGTTYGQITTSGSTHLALSPGGNVGIGTTAPSQVLDVNGDLRIRGNDITDSADATRISLGATTTLTNTTTTLSGTTTLTASSLATLTTAASLDMSSTTGLTLGDNATLYGSNVADGDLTFHGTSDATRTSSYVILQPTAGNVGIGTTTPRELLQVGTGNTNTTKRAIRVGSSYALNIQNYTNNQADSTIIQNAYIEGGNGVSATYKWVDTHASFGSRGIDFQYGASGKGIIFYADSVATTADSTFTPTQRMIIQNDGNVGIGSTTPGKALDVVGEGRFSTDLTVSGGDITGANSAAIDIGEATSGDVEITGDLLPSADATYDLGSTAKSWRNIYLTGNLCFDDSDCASTWVGLGGGSSNWTIASGTIKPTNSTLDLLVGNNATASAKFAFINVNSGTPTASISANSGNIATFLTGSGYLSTTNRQDLTIGNSAAFNSTGNVLINPNGTGSVGIGTTAPSAKLHLSDAGAVELRITAGNAGAEVDPAIRFTGQSESTAEGTLLWYDNDVGNTYFDNIYNGVDTSPAIRFRTEVASTPIDAVTILHNGNVGIGTTAPATKLSIGGATSTISNTSGDLTIDAAEDIYLVDNVGIGTTVPIAKLHVSGTASVSGVLTLGDNSATTIRPAASGNITFQRKSGVDTWADAVTIHNATGYMGIGSTNPGAPLDVVGDIYGSSGVSLYNTAVSDDTFEGAKFCTGDGETNCVTDFNALIGSANIWTDEGAYIRPTNGEVLGNSASAGTNKIAGIYLADSAPLTLGTDNDVSMTFSGTTLAVTQGNNDIDFDANTLFIDGSANNVGIGTTVPSEALHVLDNIRGEKFLDDTNPLFYLDPAAAGISLNVAGTASIGATLAFTGPTNPKIDILNDENFGMRFSPGGDAGLTELFTILNNGNVGIGTTAPATKLSIGGATSTISNTSGDLTIDAAEDIYLVDNVGIGTTVPIAKLHVSGTASVSGVLTLGDNSATTIRPAASGNITFQRKSAVNTWADVMTINNASGNVGIGSTNPAALLDVAGTARVGSLGAGATDTVITHASNILQVRTIDSRVWGTSTFVDGSGTLNYIPKWTPDGNTLGDTVMYDNGTNIGIGTTAPSQVLDVNGDLRVRGNDITDSADTTRVTLGATTTLTNTTTTLSGTTTLTAANLATLTSAAALAMSSTTSLTLGDDATIYGSDTASGDLTIHGTSNATRTTSYVIIQPTAGNVGIGTTAPTQLLDVNGDLRVRGNDITDSADTTRVTLGATTTLTNTTTTLSGTTTLTAANLATLTSAAALAMSSTTSLTLGDDATLYGSDTANGDITIHGTSNATRTSSYVILQPTAGNVGIGTTAPAATLDVAGTGIINSLTLDANSGTALTISGTSFTTDIVLQNAETIDNNTNGTITFTAPITLASAAMTVTTDLSVNGNSNLGNAAGDLTTLKGQFYRGLPLRYTITNTATNSDSDANKDTDCTTEFGTDYRAAQLLDIFANTNSNISLSASSLGYFRVRGSTAEWYTQNQAPTSDYDSGSFATAAGTGARPVACVRKDAPMLFSTGTAAYNGTDATKTTACTNSDGTNYRSATQFEAVSYVGAIGNVGTFNVANNTADTLTVTASGGIRITVNGSDLTTNIACIMKDPAAGADYAETIATTDDTLISGEILASDDTKSEAVVRSTQPYQKGLLGVVPTTPGMVIGEDINDSHATVIALAGRVPLRVSAENGPIRIGDLITSSSQPGVGMKATKRGYTVGYSMSHYDSADPNAVGTITVFVNPMYYVGDSTEPAPAEVKGIPGEINVEKVIAKSIQAETGQILALNTNALSTNELTVASADQLKIGNQKLSDMLSILKTDITQSLQQADHQLAGSAEAGDVVSRTDNQSVIKTTTEYDANVAGIISQVTSSNQVNLITAGQATAKISLENGPILAGDPLTSSGLVAGALKKSTQPGPIVARALEPLADCAQTICSGRVFVTLDYVTPAPVLSETGDVVVATNTTGQLEYQVRRPDGSVVTAVTAAAKAVIGNLQAGQVDTQELTIKGKTIDQIVDEKLATALMSVNTAKPAGETSTTELNLAMAPATAAAELTEPAISTELANLLVAQNATVAGELNADQLNTTDLTADTATITAQLDATSARIQALEAGMANLEHIRAQTAELVSATVSGTLYANNIDKLDEKIRDTLQQPSLLELLLGQDTPAAASVSAAPVVVSESTPGETLTASDSANLDLSMADLQLSHNEVSLEANAVFVDQYLRVNGTAYIADALGIGQRLQVGDGLEITAQSLAFLPPTGVSDPSQAIFSIQPSGRGKLSLMAGLVELSESGTIALNGNVNVSGNLAVSQTLLTNLLQPTEFGNPFQVQVAGIATESGEVKRSRFEIINELGTPVATISAQGKAEFAGGLAVGSQDLRVAEPVASSSAVITTNSTSGRATIPPGTNQITIQASTLTPESLVYVTPLGSTENQVLYIKSQTPTEFVVGFDQAIDKTLNFNWWLVN